MPLKLRLLLWVSNNFVKFDLSKMTVEEVRDFANNRDSSLMDGKPMALRKINNISIKGRESRIPVRMYFPDIKENVPVTVFFHGGGFVFGNLDSHDKICRRLCKMTNTIIVAVDYRLAPEHKFPAAPVDCYDVTKWVYENIHLHGGNPEKLVVMGDSAGANLATVTAIQARDLGTPKIAYQVLIYPTVDARMAYPSIEENAEGYLLTKELMEWFMDKYSRTEADKLDPLMSPILTEDLTNLPPALIQTAQYDPLRDEGIDYAKKLKEAGNEVIHTNYEGLIHSYFTMPKISKKCLAAHEEIATVLKKAFKRVMVTGD